MKTLDYFFSWITLISLFVLGPPLGRSLGSRWTRFTASVATALGTMLVVCILLGAYGLVWAARPRTVLWYAWIGEFPIKGYVSVDGDITAVIPEPLKVQVDR
jgi:hypothetical protein